MIASRSSLVLALVVVAVALLPACTCGPRETPRGPDTGLGGTPGRLPDLRQHAKRAALYTKETRRRLVGGHPPVAPARVLVRIANELPSVGVPASFATWRRAMVDKAQGLAAGAPPKPAYNSIVETCVACHRLYAPKTVPAMEALRLP